ncbi:hypothetical protein [Limnoglobus roseus]|nr:hypothetical protein [Limnoglobus roseus]
MTVVRFIAFALLALASVGCQALKDDPALGDRPWSPSSSFAGVKDR